ncbi:hypothetical protein ACMV5I_02315 [Serratia sp. T13T92]|uniref:hypothetical protein n=1 Tax=Serratia sp. T13T92 TaxID=3397496 RepID=UPI0039DF7EE2
MINVLSYEALKVERDQLRQELNAVAARNANHVQTLAGIKKMDPATEGERMQQWASDALSGYTEPVEATVKSLMDENLALTAECAAMKAIIDSVTNLDNEPQYHPEGMGCGLEDRGITDRYDAMEYGWQQAMERIYGDVIPCAEELNFSATNVALAEVETKLVEKFAEQQEEKSSAAERAGAKHLGAAHQFAALQARAFAVDLLEGLV